MNIKDMFPSRYIKQADIPIGGLILTIKSVSMESVGTGDEEKQQPTLHFSDSEKAFGLNVTNADTLADLLGLETDRWAGRRIILVWDSKVRFKGQITGGIRVATAVAAAAAAAEPAYVDQPVFPDESIQLLADALSQAATSEKPGDLVKLKSPLTDAFKAARDAAILAGVEETEIAKFRVTNRSTNAQAYAAALSLLIEADKRLGDATATPF